MKKVNLKETLDKVSYEFVTANFKFTSNETGITGFDAYGSCEWVKFFPSGEAAYSNNGNIKTTLHFSSHQDCVDFIRIK